MSKSVEKMKKASKFMTWLFVSFGVLFIGMLILFIYNTSSINPTVVAVIGGIALVLFLMAFLLPRITITRLERDDGWSRPTVPFILLVIFFIPLEIILFYLILSVVWIYRESGEGFLSVGFFLIQSFLILFLAPVLYLQIYMRKMMKLYDGYQSKSFPDFSPKTMDLIAYLFKKHDIECTFQGEKKAGFGMTYNEILKLPHGVFIRFHLPKIVSRKVSWVHPETGFDFTVEVGPETEENRDFIQEIKRIVDQLEDE